MALLNFSKRVSLSLSTHQHHCSSHSIFAITFNSSDSIDYFALFTRMFTHHVLSLATSVFLTALVFAHCHTHAVYTCTRTLGRTAGRCHLAPTLLRRGAGGAIARYYVSTIGLDR